MDAAARREPPAQAGTFTVAGPGYTDSFHASTAGSGSATILSVDTIVTIDKQTDVTVNHLRIKSLGFIAFDSVVG